MSKEPQKVKVRLKYATKINKVWHKPKTVVELDELIVEQNPSAYEVLSGDSVKAVNNESEKEEFVSLVEQLENVEDGEVAEAIWGLGITSIDDLANADVKQLKTIKGVGEATAKKIIEEAKETEVE